MSVRNAELLCSRMGIMQGGFFSCIGAPQELRAKYTSGYVLSVKLRDQGNRDLATARYNYKRLQQRLLDFLQQGPANYDDHAADLLGAGSPRCVGRWGELLRKDNVFCRMNLVVDFVFCFPPSALIFHARKNATPTRRRRRSRTLAQSLTALISLTDRPPSFLSCPGAPVRASRTSLIARIIPRTATSARDRL